MIRIETITADSPHLATVMSLHKADGRNLGMFPKGAFQEHAVAGQILLALTEGGECVGYLLYRTAREKATIVHLCIRADFRRKGVARALIEKLKSVSNHLQGIGLYCRRDYEANQAWPKYGFIAISAKRGRGSDGAELEYWWLNHNKPDLFSLSAPSTLSETRLRVVIDANVFYDLHERDTQESEESKALFADWLQESIELWLTPEIYNEIRRAPSEDQRKRSRALVSKYPMVKTDDAIVQKTVADLRAQFPGTLCLRDDSDVRQVAHAIAAEAPFFLTRDRKLIERCEPLLDIYGLHVLHPTDLINELDGLRREAEYRPVRLEGSRITASLLRTDQLEMVVESFLLPSREKPSVLERSIRYFLARPAEFDCRIVLTEGKRPLALLVRTSTPDADVNIPLFRLADHALAPTIARHLLRLMMEREARLVPMLRVTDDNLGDHVKIALAEMGFVLSPEGWWKVSLCRLETSQTVKASVDGFSLPGQVLTAIQAGISGYLKEQSALRAAEIEKVLWPIKLSDAPLVTFIVPIRAQWAQHFFDSDLGGGLLFGLKDELHLGVEGAYYCSKRNTQLHSPSRVLWYVSKGSEGLGSMSVKACSRVEEVILGKPKEVFKKFKRLGVYQWRDVLSASGGDLDNQLIAFRFSMTERFAQPVTRAELADVGVASPIMSPRKITQDQFAQIYRRGRKL